VASNDLVFVAAPLTTGDLVFGDDGSNPISDAVISGTIALARPTLRGVVTLGIVASGTVVLTRPTLTGEIKYVSDTQRPLVAQAAVRFQDADPSPERVQHRFQDGIAMPAAAEGRFQDAARLSVGKGISWQEADRTKRQSIAGRWQDGLKIRTGARARFQEAIRAPRSLRTHFENGASTLRGWTAKFNDGLRVPNRQAVRYQDAVALQVAVASSGGYALKLQRGWTTRYQEGIQPRPGRTVLVPVIPPVDPCYTPDGDLVFEVPWSADTNLVFVCEKHTPEPGETVVIPVRRVYVVENHITLHRVDTGAAIEADAFSMSLDVDSWTWTWSASLPASALALIEPGGDGDPVDIETSVNGVAFRLCAESYSRERSFGKARIRVQGRGRGAILDAPYAPTLNHFSAGALTAQQLAALALTINGVGIGWDVAWGLEDWNVPGGTWNIQGSYITAVQDIVRAAGGYVQPHRTAATLRVLPRYPATPWTWGALTPDFELPSAIASVEGIEWRSLPAYDRVFVGGTTAAGVLGQVTRAGTAGGSVAPMVTHPLITDAIAARQRGLAELANTGRQALVTLRMPVLAETGIIQPGALVRYVDGSTTRLGLVRSTSVSWDRPVLRQTIGLETHVD
jgi:hypothetical protein